MRELSQQESAWVSGGDGEDTDREAQTQMVGGIVGGIVGIGIFIWAFKGCCRRGGQGNQYNELAAAPVTV